MYGKASEEDEPDFLRGIDMKISYKKLVFTSIAFITIVFANYYALFPSISYTVVPLLMIALFIASSVESNCGLVISKKSFKGHLSSYLLILLSLIGNQSLARHDYVSTLRFIALILVGIGISNVPARISSKSFAYFSRIGFANVIATWLFLFFPSAYSLMISIYGYIPTGTGNGQFGYRAGIADHYSQNSFFIAIVVISITTQILLNYKPKIPKSRMRLLYALDILAMLALIFTTKRGPLLFAVISIVAVYYIINSSKIFTTTFKVVIFGLLLLTILYFTAPIIPGMNTLLVRFASAGNDGETLTRFKMWDLAWRCFCEKPILGIGWFGFRYRHASEIFNAYINDARYMYLHAHNVYLQMLCERGIIGFVVYIWFLVGNLAKPIQVLIHQRLSADKKTALAVSVAIQLFYIFYSLTGNCLYDMMFCFYVVAAGIARSISNLRKDIEAI